MVYKQKKSLKAYEDPFSAVNMIRDGLRLLGYTDKQLVLDGTMYYHFTSPNGHTWLAHCARLNYPFLHPGIEEISKNKSKSHDLAELAHMPVPLTIVVHKNDTIDKAIEVVNSGKTIIVKPLDSSLSKGLSLDIVSEADLKKALKHAYIHSDTALVQEQVYGEEIRFTLVQGKVVAALLRQTPRIVGDGVSTISELIDAENRVRESNLAFERVKYPQLSSDMIPKSLFHDKRVLLHGEMLELNRATMIRNGASIFEVLDQIHPSYLAEVERLAEMLSTDFIVIDLMLADMKSVAAQGNYWFIEFNTLPALKLYYACRDGKFFDIIPDLVRLTDAAISQGLTRDQ